MKNILAVESASSLLGVALKCGEKVIYREILDGFKHSENLSPLIDEILKVAGLTCGDLDLMICSRGPGSFTGLRIGMATLKGISMALDIPLVSVPTLDLYAYGKDEFDGVVIPAIDARKRCFYISINRNGNRESEYLDISPDDISRILKNENKVLITGVNAPELYNILNDDKIILDNSFNSRYAEVLIEIGLNYFNKYGADSDDQGPLYIRKSEAEIELEKRLKKSAE